MKFLTLLSALTFCGIIFADEPEIERPRIFLDKSPRIVEYQLKRLDNARLLLVETATDDPKYLPVFNAILLRPGLSRKDRDDALYGLATIKKTDVTSELLAAIQGIDADDSELQRVGRELIDILLTQPAKELQQKNEQLNEAAQANGLMQTAGLTGLIMAEKFDSAWQTVQTNPEATLAFLDGVELVPNNVRNTLRPNVVTLFEAASDNKIMAASMKALAAISAEQADTFERLAPHLLDTELQQTVVNGLLSVPNRRRSAKTSARLVEQLVAFAEKTPAADRTSDDFLNAMQLADELLSKVPAEKARSYRDRLREIVVRVVRIHTIEEEMRYDKTFFVVEAGRPVQIVLENEDLMPHNLVITSPGKLKDVALEGAALGTTPGKEQKLYVPESNDVLFASTLVNAGQREILTFTAPTEPGEYPYVCTFPRHWMRMYGVMLVVPDLDEWNRNPVEPKDPLGNTRSFVKSWTLNDFRQEEFDQRLYGRLESSGAKLFKEATCLGCHKMKGEGGAVGPELTDLMKRWKGNKHAVLREILEPSYQIDPKYAQKIVLDDDGKQTVGIVVAEDKKSISLLENAEAKEPTVIQKDNIDEIIASPTSLMPKALMDKFTEDEILDLLNYITQAE